MRPAVPLTFLLLIASCAGPERAHTGEGKGGRHYGGVLNWNEAAPVRSIHPTGLVTAAGFRVGSLVYEGLVRCDPHDLSIDPVLAERWEVDSTGTIYTFHLRKEVQFHPDPIFQGEPRMLTASDVEHCFKRICGARPGNQMFWLFQGRVKGADAFHAADAQGPATASIEGIQVLDPRTVRIELVAPDPLFLQVLSHQGCWIYPPELEQAEPLQGLRAIGTGPFILRTPGTGDALVFERSPVYWRQDELGNALPFLDAVRVTFNEDKSAEMDAFLKGRLTVLVDPPLERMDALRDTVDPATGTLRFRVQRAPGLSVQFYGFNPRVQPFDRVDVRRAFALAIDRRMLVDSVLQGAAVVADHGVVPPGLKGYPQELVSGIGYSPDRARELLAGAGYPAGRGFPSVRLQVSNDGFGYVRVAEAVQGMLERNLGIGISISMLPSAQHYELVDGAKAQFWRQGWVADYPDPENFLALFYGRNAVLDSTLPSPLNTTRYHDAVFDSLFQQARTEHDQEARMRSLALAEQRMMTDVPVVPLYFERTIRLVQPWVRDMPMNPMDQRDIAVVWFDPLLRPR